jgi:hypothetical protein
MRDAAEMLFEDENLSGDAAAVDEVIERAGGDVREAIRALLVALAEQERARRAAEGATSLGYRRGAQPRRRLP